MDQYIGKMLDNRYEILEIIGTGGMAVVYKAKCHLLNRLVAVKILKNDLAHDEDFRRRFNAESQAVAQLSHPNIMSVYDVSRGGDTEYIVMELINGITLKQYMERRGQLNWRESLHFITQIMRGLSHAHSRGIVHRDIKPQNIMVLRDGSVKVADFGIACLENSAQTLTQEALGSVHYISPEQARGDRTDPRSDLYSAGVVLYEMLTGRLPFEGDSPVSVAIQHLSSVPLAPREIKEDIPEPLELICMKAMASDIHKRYASADDMISDLDTFRKNPGVSLDFELSDLRPEETDEPTQPLHIAVGRQRPVSETGRNREPQRNYEDYEEETNSGKSKKQIVLIAIAGILAILLAFTLIRSILNSFNQQTTDQYVVKNVVGLTVEEARNLEGVKDIFKIVEAEEAVFSDEFRAGLIVEQDPKENEYRKGDSMVITVWVSKGEEIGEMIDVTNKVPAQATLDLKSLVNKYDLTIDSNVVEQFHDTVEAGYIISTIPAAKEPLRKGDTIQLIVSKGPELKPVPVPNFVGENFYEIQGQLLNVWKLNCDPATDIKLVDSDKSGGIIIWQSIPANTTAMEGDTIQFHISSGLATTVEQREIDVVLPQDGRKKVYLEVYVGEEQEPQYADTIRYDADQEYAEVTLQGTGTQYVRILFDGELDSEQSHYLQFN